MGPSYGFYVYQTCRSSSTKAVQIVWPTEEKNDVGGRLCCVGVILWD